MIRTMKQMGQKAPVAEWDPETIDEDKLAEIREQFDDWLAKRGIAFDVSIENKEKGADGTMMREFDRNKDILLAPYFQGGCHE